MFCFVEKYIGLFILYIIIQVICPKNNQTSVTTICHTTIRYPAISLLGQDATHRYPRLTSMVDTPFSHTTPCGNFYFIFSFILFSLLK